MKPQEAIVKSLHTELSMVKSRFPANQSAIEKLYRKDPDFRTLCTDLFLCSRMIQDFEKEIAEKQHALGEYREIVIELEKELYMVIRGEEA